MEKRDISKRLKYIRLGVHSQIKAKVELETKTIKTKAFSTVPTGVQQLSINIEWIEYVSSFENLRSVLQKEQAEDEVSERRANANRMNSVGTQWNQTMSQGLHPSCCSPPRAHLWEWNVAIKSQGYHEAGCVRSLVLSVNSLYSLRRSNL